MNKLLSVVVYSFILSHVSCWDEIDYDKDGDLSLDELSKKYGSVGIISYELTLPDGYIIEVFRLDTKGAEKLKPILLMHGLSACAASFFIDKKKALPFFLARQGYDVWMINNRGTLPSKRHTSLNSTTDSAYWEFSWQEMGLMDLPATIDLVLENNVHDKVALVGHSEGSYIIFVTLAELPEYNEKVAISFHWGATAYHSACTFDVLSAGCTYSGIILNFLDMIGVRSLIPDDGLRNMIIKLCRLDIFNVVCRDVIFETLVVTPESFDEFEDISYFFTKWLCGGSTREFIHFLQIGFSGSFARFDYGEEENKRIYNSTKPPPFHLERITSPTAIFCGLGDLYCTEKDIRKASGEIPNVVFTGRAPRLGHADFILSKMFTTYVLDDMIMLLNKYF